MPISALGKKVKNNELKEIGNVSRSELKKMRDTRLLTVAEEKRDTAEAKAAELTGFGISGVVLADYRNLIEVYRGAIGQKESAKGAKTGATGTLSSLFKQNDDILTIINDIMEGMKKEHLEFYNGYHANRAIRDLGKGRRIRTGTLGQNETVNIFSLGIDDTTSFKIKNTGESQLKFFASNSVIPNNEPGITVEPGKEITATALQLGNSGSKLLNVTNLSTSNQGMWKVKKNS